MAIVLPVRQLCAGAYNRTPRAVAARGRFYSVQLSASAKTMHTGTVMDDDSATG